MRNLTLCISICNNLPLSSETCDKKLPEAEQVAASGRLDEALELLAGLEKQTRSGADTHSTGRVLVTIVQLCFNAKDWQQLNERIIDLVKKRSQLKQVNRTFVLCILSLIYRRLPR